MTRLICSALALLVGTSAGAEPATPLDLVDEDGEMLRALEMLPDDLGCVAIDPETRRLWCIVHTRDHGPSAASDLHEDVDAATDLVRIDLRSLEEKAIRLAQTSGHLDSSTRTWPKRVKRFNEDISKKGYLAVQPRFETTQAAARWTLERGLVAELRGSALQLSKAGAVLAVVEVGDPPDDAEYVRQVRLYLSEGVLIVHSVSFTSDGKYNQITTFLDGLPLAELTAERKCPKGVHCPPNYTRLYPYLGRFCADRVAGADLAQLRSDVDAGKLVAADLRVLFNSYGALEGYPFKNDKLRGFFYGPSHPKPTAGGPFPRPDASRSSWLPASCRRAYASVQPGTQPARLREYRDAVKKLWRAVK